jgi:hypothetical protein
MNKKAIGIGIILILIVVGLTGCQEEQLGVKKENRKPSFGNVKVEEEAF